MPHKITALFACVLFCAALFSCSSKINQKERKIRGAGMEARKQLLLLEEKKSAALDQYIKTLSQRERLAQLFVINLEGSKEFSFVEWLEEDGQKKPLIPGGYIFFSFNIADDPKIIASFTDSVRAFAKDNSCAEPFLCLDAEGGYVNRLRYVAGPLPENEWVAKNLSVKEAFLLYSLNAIQLRALGFDLNLAPVVETQNSTNQKFLDGRSFGDAALVKKYASCSIDAYKQNKVSCALKHFPGNNSVDPHFALPILTYTKEELEKDVLEPFSFLAKEKPAAILMSHALVQVEGEDLKKIPASLSPYWIKGLLRGRLSFKGLVFSDDIFMAALEKNGYPSERAVKSAILSGVDCILMSEKRFINEWTCVKKLYDSDLDFRAAADEAIKRVFSFKLDAGILAYDFESQKILLPKGRPSVQERMERFYGAKKLNEEALKKYGQK